MACNALLHFLHATFTLAWALPGSLVPAIRRMHGCCPGALHPLHLQSCTYVRLHRATDSKGTPCSTEMPMSYILHQSNVIHDHHWSARAIRQRLTAGLLPASCLHVSSGPDTKPSRSLHPAHHKRGSTPCAAGAASRNRTTDKPHIAVWPAWMRVTGVTPLLCCLQSNTCATPVPLTARQGHCPFAMANQWQAAINLQARTGGPFPPVRVREVLFLPCMCREPCRGSGTSRDWPSTKRGGVIGTD